MTQLEPRTPTTSPRPDETGPSPQHHESPFNWRVSVGMAIGLLVLFGALFGLRALHIFPPEPGQDPEIVAARATLGVIQTQTARAPRPATAAAAAPATAPTSAPAAAPTPAPIATSAPTPAAVQQPATQPQPTADAVTAFETAPRPAPASAGPALEPTAVPTLTPAGNAPTVQATADSAQTEPTPVVVNLSASLASALLQSYSHYWDIRLQAIRDPSDASIDLESVMAGNELEGARKTLAEMRDHGEAGYSTVKHTVWITHATDQEAVIVDHYVAQTIKLDPETKSPLQSDPTIEQYSDTFQLQNLDGTWKVVREDAGQQ